MAKLFNLENKNVLLTGASKGMGLAMAQGLVNHGANVVISSRKLDQCEKAAKTINDSIDQEKAFAYSCLLYTSPSPRDMSASRMPSSA